MAAKATIRTGGGGGGSASDLPSAEITKASTNMAFATSANGIRVGIVKPSAIRRMRLMRMLGKDAANAVLFGNCMLACLVCEINGDKIATPNSYREIEILVERLDDDGLNAVVEAMKEFGIAPTPEEQEEALRNFEHGPDS